MRKENTPLSSHRGHLQSRDWEHKIRQKLVAVTRWTYLQGWGGKSLWRLVFLAVSDNLGTWSHAVWMRKQRGRYALTVESVSSWCVTNCPMTQCLETMVIVTYIICVLGWSCASFKVAGTALLFVARSGSGWFGSGSHTRLVSCFARSCQDHVNGIPIHKPPTKQAAP